MVRNFVRTDNRGCMITEVVETNFEVDGVMMRSSKEDFVWCESCRVEAIICCGEQVEFSKSVRSSSILFGEMPGKLKSPQIIRRSAASVPRVARIEPNSSRNIDLLDERGWYMYARTISRDLRPIFTSF